MAGGIGSRFWPLSKTDLPKQFLDILGTGKTLIQQTYDRLNKVCDAKQIYVVTHKDYLSLVQEQLPQLDHHQILLEPSRKNTAPCIAYATYKIEQQNKNANFIVSPADHLILKEQEFLNCINIALEQATLTDNLVTLGIKPSRPDTGYGYIQFEDLDSNESNRQVKRVKTFTEKPDAEMAQKFIESGEFFWNSGIFIWNISTIQKAFETHLPDLSELFSSKPELYYTDQEQEFIEKTYTLSVNTSIDYGILEKSKNVLVVLSDFGWSDLGTWGSVYTHINKDADHNAIISKHFRAYESSKNMVFQKNDEKMTLIEGLENYIIVDTEKALLICKKDSEQKIKTFVSDLKVNHPHFT